MRKIIIASGLALSLAACGSVPTIVASVFDLVNDYTLKHCGYTFASATIDAVIKAFGGQPVDDVIGSFLCTQAKMLTAQQGPKAATVVTPTGEVGTVLGTVVIGGKPIKIVVLR
jgi:hypothetical protein